MTAAPFSGYDRAMNVMVSRALRLAEGAPRDPDGFLAWAANTPALEGYKVELADGEVSIDAVNTTRAHSLICTNLMVGLFGQIDSCDSLITSAGFGVRTPDGIRYPDILVDATLGSGQDYAAREPVLIVEVLSPSSIAIDMVEKREEYLQIPTLQAYLVCAQDEPRAWAFLRENGAFPASPVMIEGREAAIDIPVLSLTLPMAGIFAGIPDAPTPA